MKNKRICKVCDMEQVYERKRNGIPICNYCEEPLPLPDKIPESTVIIMGSNGHSKPLSK